MKLLEIVVNAYEEWPEQDFITQDSDGELRGSCSISVDRYTSYGVSDELAAIAANLPHHFNCPYCPLSDAVELGECLLETRPDLCVTEAQYDAYKLETTNAGSQ